MPYQQKEGKLEVTEKSENFVIIQGQVSNVADNVVNRRITRNKNNQLTPEGFRVENHI